MRGHLSGHPRWGEGLSPQTWALAQGGPKRGAGEGGSRGTRARKAGEEGTGGQTSVSWACP